MASYGSGAHYKSGHNYGEGPTVYPEEGFTLLEGGNHLGKDWVLPEDVVVGGHHYNVGHFEVPSGVTISVNPYNGASISGSFEVDCQSASVIGVLTGSVTGYGGGGGGGGGGGAGSQRAGAGGAGGASVNDGLPGTDGFDGSVGASAAGGAGGGGGAGSGPYAPAVGGVGGASGGGNGSAGSDGGYAVIGGQGDTSTDTSLLRGSGGAGGGGGGGQNTVSGVTSGGGGGGGANAGGSGGGKVRITARGSGILVSGSFLDHGGFRVGGVDGQAATVASGGAGGVGGAASEEADIGPGIGGASAPTGSPGGNGANGGLGAGGGVLLQTPGPRGLTIAGELESLGGGTSPVNGGTFKRFISQDVGGVAVKYFETGTVSTGRNYENDGEVNAQVI